MKPMLLIAFLSLAVSLAAAEKPYDFRTSAAYEKLSPPDRQRLEQVHHDLVLLGAHWTCLPKRTTGICLRALTN